MVSSIKILISHQYFISNQQNSHYLITIYITKYSKFLIIETITCSLAAKGLLWSRVFSSCTAALRTLEDLSCNKVKVKVKVKVQGSDVNDIPASGQL